MKTISIIALSSGLLAALTAQGDSVLNGGFETGDLSGWSVNAASGGSDYLVASSGFAGVSAHSGDYMLAVGAVGGQNDLFSQVVTTPGDFYNFSFWLSNADGQNASYLTATWNGNELLNITPSQQNFGWTQFSYTECATGPTSTIGFAGRNVPAWIMIDDVKVTSASAVPEPPVTIAGCLLLLPCAYRAVRSIRRK